MNKVTLELTEHEMIVIMSALKYTSTQEEIRTDYTCGTKSSDLTEAAGKVFEELNDENYQTIYQQYTDIWWPYEYGG